MISDALCRDILMLELSNTHRTDLCGCMDQNPNSIVARACVKCECSRDGPPGPRGSEPPLTTLLSTYSLAKRRGQRPGQLAGLQVVGEAAYVNFTRLPCHTGVRQMDPFTFDTRMRVPPPFSVPLRCRPGNRPRSTGSPKSLLMPPDTVSA